MIDFLGSYFIAHPALGYLGAFAAAFLEATPFVGVFVPGTALLVLLSFFAEQWPVLFDIRAVAVMAVLGAFLGNVTSYLVGRYYGPPLFTERGFFLKRRYLVRAQQYFGTHGGKSVFSGQFLGPLRSVVSLVAGMAEMRLLPFLFYSGSASIGWVIVYGSLGYLFGASWEAIALWGSRFTIFLIIIAAVVALNWLLGRFLIRHEIAVRDLMHRMGTTVSRWLFAHPRIVAFAARHERLFSFVRHRFSPYRALGLSFTVGLILSFVILDIFLDLMLSIVAGPLQGIDERLLAAALFIRDPWINHVMLVITNLAGPALILISASVVTWFMIERRWFRASLLVGGLIVITALQYGLKLLFGRARPSFGALVAESSHSFPSGHAVLAVVFYGFLCYVICGRLRSWRMKISMTLGTVCLIALIAFSRVYLGVHWPSDVFGGLLIGAWWLTILLTILYTRESFYAPPASHPLKGWRRTAAGLALALVIGWAAIGFIHYIRLNPLRVISVGQLQVLPRRTVPTLTPDVLATIPTTTETVQGNPQTPINLVLVGSRQAVERAFFQADWTIADPATLLTVGRIIRSSLDNRPYPTAPISPSFYEDRVQDIGVQRATDADTARQRHHARLWLAPIVLADGTDVWMVTASFDQGVAYSPVWKFPIHTISPNIDGERDQVLRDLITAGAVRRLQTVHLNSPGVGLNGGGDYFFTDGRAYVLWLKP